MSDGIFVVQYGFYVLVLLIVASIMGGWLGLGCGLLAGFMIIWIIMMLINGDTDSSFAERGR